MLNLLSLPQIEAEQTAVLVDVMLMIVALVWLAQIFIIRIAIRAIGT